MRCFFLFFSGAVLAFIGLAALMIDGGITRYRRKRPLFIADAELRRYDITPAFHLPENATKHEESNEH